MSKKIVPGLQPIVPPASAPRQPGLISAAELKRLETLGGDLRFVRSVESIDSVTDALLAIQSQLQFFAETGRNPGLVGVEDFNVLAVLTQDDPAGSPIHTNNPVQLVFQSRTDKDSFVVIAAYPPTGVALRNFHSATPTTLLSMAGVE